MQGWISPWEYRQLRGCGITRVAGASVAAGAGLICLAYDADKWAAFYLTVGGLNLAGGYWYLTIDRSVSASARRPIRPGAPLIDLTEPPAPNRLSREVAPDVRDHRN
jgi:hypothetical protein